MAENDELDDQLDLNDGPEEGEINAPEDAPAVEEDYSGEDLFEDTPPVAPSGSARDRSANARIRELIAEKKRSDELLQQLIQNQNRQQTPIDEDLSPEERRIRNLEQQLAQSTAMSWDRADKSDFRSLQAINPMARKLANEVEQEVIRLRQQGMNLPREEVFAWILGKKMMANGSKNKPASGRTGSSAPRTPAVAGNTQARKGGPKKASDMSLEEFEAQFGSTPI